MDWTWFKGFKLWTPDKTFEINKFLFYSIISDLLNWFPIIGIGRAMTRIPKMAQTAPTSRPRPVIGTTCKKIGSMEIFLWISIFLFELMEFCVFYHICICGVVFWYSMITIFIYALKLYISSKSTANLNSTYFMYSIINLYFHLSIPNGGHGDERPPVGVQHRFHCVL